MSNIITAAERAARRANSAPNVTATPANRVGWRKKGCMTCGPKVFSTRKL